MKTSAFSQQYRKFGILIIFLSLISLLGINSCQKKEEISSTDVVQLKNGSVRQGDIVIFWGHETFTRSTSKPVIVKKKISNVDLKHFEPGFVIHLQNGNGTTNMVSSAIIKIDGKQIFLPSDFSQNVKTLSKEVTGLTENSEIEVEVRGVPLSFIDVWIEGYLKPGSSYVDANGGSLTSDDGLLNLSIPSDAISEGIILSALEEPDYTLPENFVEQLKGPVYSLKPDKLEFQDPVTVTISINPALYNNINNIRILHWNLENNYEIIIPDIDLNKNELVFNIDHFSFVGTFESVESSNSFLVNNTEHTLNQGYSVWFSELDCGNKDIFAHGIYLTSNISISSYNTGGGSKALIPYGKGNIIIFNLFNKSSTLTAGKYTFVDNVNCDGTVTDGGNTFTMNSADKFVTSVKEMNDPTCYGLNVDLDIDWANVDFSNPSQDVLTKYSTYTNSRIGIKEGSVNVVIDGSKYVISFDCIDNKGIKITGNYTGALNYLEFPI